MRRARLTQSVTRSFRHKTDMLPFLDCFRDTIPKLRRGTVQHINSLQKEENGRLPIHQLPRELFVLILDLAIEPPRLEALKKLTGVCWSWAHIIHRTPSLWATVDAVDDLSEALERSKSCVLSTWHTGLRIAEGRGDIVERLVGCCLQWKNMHLVLATEHANILTQVKHCTLSCLELLDITVEYDDDDDDDPTIARLFDINTPNLKVFRLHGANLPLEPVPAYFYGIRVLQLTGGCITAKQVLDLIKDNHALITLYIEGLRYLSEPEGVPNNFARCETVKEVNLLRGSARQILPWIETPQCESMSAVIDIHEDAVPLDAGGMFRHFVQHVECSHLDLAITWIIEGKEGQLGRNGFWYTGTFKGPKTYDLEILVYSNLEKGEEWVNTVRSGLHLLSRPPTMKLEFDWSNIPWHTNVLAPGLLAGISKLPVTNLTFHHKIPHELSSLLCNPISDRLSATQWAFPDLETIHLCDNIPRIGVNTMISCIANRYGRKGIAGPEMRLKAVHLPTWAAKVSDLPNSIMHNTGVPPSFPGLDCTCDMDPEVENCD